MRKPSRWSALVLLCCAFAIAQQKAAEPAPNVPSISQVLNDQLSAVENVFVPAAEAMSEDKYGFSPTNGEFNGVRTFAQQVKHSATVNYLDFAAIAGEKPPVDTGIGESGPNSVASKAEIVAYLRDSFAYGHKVLAGVTPQNATLSITGPNGRTMTTRLRLALQVMGHCFDHYGQMVEYLRMNGVIPPASQRRQPSSSGKKD